MIISCEKCNKKFELDNNLMPDTGRLLQCGSCSHQWHYKPKSKVNIPDKAVELNNEVFQDIVATENKKNEETKISKRNEIKDNDNKKSLNITKFLNILIVFIISFAALILFVETFKFQISYLIPDIDFFLSSLYESLKDIYLFFKDLLK